MKKFIIKTEDNINDSFLMKLFDNHLPSEYIIEEIDPVDEEKLDEFAKSLMINDWVILKSNGVFPDSYVKIESISKDGAFVTACDNLIRFDELEFIPLTEDIVEENGLLNSIERICQVMSDNTIEYHFNIGDNFKRITVQLKFVHELQHALRLCNLYDLANNFKIKL